MDANVNQAVLELNGWLSELNDFKEFPVNFQAILQKFLPFDWCAMYSWEKDTNISINTNTRLPFNWEELYEVIAPYDTFAQRVFSRPQRPDG